VTDPAAGDTPEQTPASETPVLTATQIEDMISRKAQEISDKRVSGLQSLYDRKLKEIADENKRISRALAGTEDDPRSSDLEAELRRQERENQVLKVALANPELAPFLTRLDPDASPEDLAATLLAYRESFSQQAAPPSAPEPRAEPLDIPGVEPNRPPRERSGFELGTNPTAEQADDYFEKLASWPGLQRTLR
jgi:hypothetical protein